MLLNIVKIGSFSAIRKVSLSSSEVDNVSACKRVIAEVEQVEINVK